MRLRDRHDAGQRLSRLLIEQRKTGVIGEIGDDAIVLALPRGGVQVAAPIAAALGAILDVFVSRKIGAPNQPELGVGAIAEQGPPVLHTRTISELGIGTEQLERAVASERREVQRRIDIYRGGADLPDLRGRDVIIVDDGLATGVTAEAAIAALRLRSPRRVILAVPVAAADTLARLESKTDGTLCLHASTHFEAVGRWYDDFGQLSDADVLDALRRAREP